MKKLLLTALIAVSLISSSFAEGEKTINQRIKSNFAYDFRDVQNVKWRSGESYVIASFVTNNKGTEAFYDYAGNHIGTAYAVTMRQLPVSVKRALAKRYKDYTVKETIGFEKDDELSYFVSLSNGKESLIIQVLDGQISLYKKLS